MIRYNNIICSIVKDETPYLVEWIEYHLNIGVQYFVIYDNNSVIPVRQTLRRYINEGLVEVIDCPIIYLPQVKAYNHCLYKMHDITQWIAYIDADEFIILNKHEQINELLKEYDSFGGLCLNWELHNASGHVDKPKESVMDAYKEYLPHPSAVNKHIKTILQPRFTHAMRDPHSALYEVGCYAVNENYQPVLSAFSDFSNKVAHINHYYTKSFEEWLNKIGRGRSNANQMRKINEFWDCNPNMLYQKCEAEEKYKDVIENYENRCQIVQIQSNPSKWEPLLSGIEKQRVERNLNEVEKIIAQHYAETNNLGLLQGQSGMSIFYFNLFQLTNNPVHEDFAYKILENITLKINEIRNNHSFVDGLCGIGWFIEYLAQNQFIENNTNEVLSDVDSLFKDSIFNLLNFRFTDGLISYGMYFLARLSNSDNFSIEFKKMLVQIVNYLECYLPEKVSEADEPENLTLLQGYLAVIPFLCQVYNANVNNYRILRILEKYVDSILQFEKQQETALRFPNQIYKGVYHLQWNCGDLAVANALLQASKITNNKEWENKALEILLRTTLVKEINSSSIAIIDGTAGIAYLYNRLFQHYQIPELKEAAFFWLDRTLNLLENQNEVTTEYGLLNGLAGVGLMLMATISEIEPSWDSAVLMN